MMQRILYYYSKQSPKSLVVRRLVYLLVLVIVMDSLLFLNDYHLEHNIEFLSTTPSSKITSTSSSVQSLQSTTFFSKYLTTTTTKQLEKDYYVFHNVCLESLGNRQWNLHSPIRSKIKKIKFKHFEGGSDFAHEHFHIVYDKKLNIKDGSRSNNNSTNQIQKGTYMIIGITHANNYHHISDFLLHVFRLFQMTEVTGLLIPQGCVYCWEARLPIQSIGLDMMNITVYPMEELIKNTTPPMCFDRFIIERFNRSPYMKQWGRFSKIWPYTVFTGFRDSMHKYVRNQLQSQEIGEYDTRNIANNTKDNRNNTSQNRLSGNMETIEISNVSRTKPVLTWMSRASVNCFGRCITNHQDVVTHLSKYFDVNIIDFSTGLTTLQALSYIQKTDVFIGLHGAGLAYTAFLKGSAMLVELKGEFGNRMFINMASTMNIPYYAISLQGCIGPGENDVYTLPPDSMNDISKEIYDAYLYETKKLIDEGPSMHNGKCEFPHPVIPCGHLSSKDKSRCYLHQRWKIDLWFQCTWYHKCK